MGMQALNSRNTMPAPLSPPLQHPTHLACQVCMITGGNAGIGYATAQQLASRGAHVILVCRDLGRGKAALEVSVSCGIIILISL